MPAQAPTGGIVSEVNGQFYNGGEFIPDTGLHCGKGKNRVAMSEFNEMAKIAESKGYRLEYNQKLELFRVLCPTGNCMTSAKSLGTLKKFSYVFG